MTLLGRNEIVGALTRLGELAAAEGQAIELLAFGGSVMVLEFDARPSTRDVDAITLASTDPNVVRRLANIVASERNWANDWLNDAVKGFLAGPATLNLLFKSPGITVSRPSLEQLLAMKLCACRDDVDVSDARRLLAAISGRHDEVWTAVTQHLQPGGSVCI